MSPSGGGGGDSSCNSADMSEGVGGIQSPAYLYNISDISNLVFSGDNRSDDSLVVDTVVTDEPFYSIDFSSAEFSEEINEDKRWSQSLTLTIANVSAEFEDLLADASNGKYFVCFKPKGASDYRGFGWRYGASLAYSVSISEDDLGYSVTLSDVGEYPLLSVNSENFNVRDKVFSPIFEPLYSSSYCEQNGGANNGYAVAMYVVKVNSAGQALDSDNKLCQWSGKKQDAYKLNSVSSNGGYNIIGTYGSTATFDGKPVRVYNLSSCPSSVQGSITVNGASSTSVAMNSTTNTESVSVYSTDNWSVIDSPLYATMTPNSHSSGTTQARLYANRIGGNDTITLQNTVTREIVTIESVVCIIDVGTAMTYPHGTTTITISPTVYGGDADYTFTVSPSISAVKDGMNLVLSPTVSSSTQEFTITLTHVSDANEVKTVHVTVLGNDETASWQILSEFCEIE